MIDNREDIIMANKRIKGITKRRRRNNPNRIKKSGIYVMFRNRYELCGRRLSWLGFNKNISFQYFLNGEVKREVVDALINELYFTNVKEPSQGNMEEDIDKIIEKLSSGRAIMDGGLTFYNKRDDWDIEECMDTGCCCGTEMAMGILYGMLHYHSPWMGHDPWTTVSFNGEVVVICDDNYKWAEVTYSKEEFRQYVKEAAEGYVNFVEGVMTDRIKALCPQKADEFMEAFKYSFDIYPLTDEDFEYFDTHTPDEKDDEPSQDFSDSDFVVGLEDNDLEDYEFDDDYISSDDFDVADDEW